MNDLMRFEFSGRPVRVLMVDGEPWWVARDVCEVLGLGDQRQSTRHLDDDEKGVSTIHTLGGPQQMTTINEPGLYSLVLRSRRPEAREFKRWITHDVLPQIRREGAYQVEKPREIVFAEAVVAANEMLEEFRGKAEAYDGICDATGTFTISDTAKNIGWGPKRFCEQLREDHVLFYRRQGSSQVNIPYQTYLDRGWFLTHYDNRLASRGAGSSN